MSKRIEKFLDEIEAGNQAAVSSKLKSIRFKRRLGQEIGKALLAAAEHGQLDILNLLFQFKSSTKEITEIDNLLINIAAASGHTAIVERLLKIPAISQFMLNDKSYITLLCAIEIGKRDLIYLLINHYRSHEIAIDENIIKIPEFNDLNGFIREYNSNISSVFNLLPIHGLWKMISEFDPSSPAITVSQNIPHPS